MPRIEEDRRHVGTISIHGEDTVEVYLAYNQVCVRRRTNMNPDSPWCLTEEETKSLARLLKHGASLLKPRKK